MSGISTKKFAREVLKKSGADQMIPVRKSCHQIFEFRRKGVDKGVVYTLPVSASCHRAVMNASRDIKRQLDALANAQLAMTA